MKLLAFLLAMMMIMAMMLMTTPREHAFYTHKDHFNPSAPPRSAT